MIIKNIEAIDYAREAKRRVYDFVRAVNSHFTFNSFSLIELLIFRVALIFPFVSVLFKRDQFFPQTASQAFRTFLITSIESNYGVDPAITYAIVLTFTFAVAFLTAIHFAFSQVLETVTKVLSFLIRVSYVLLVPFVDFAVACYQRTTNISFSVAERAVAGTTALLVTITVAVVCLQQYFQVRILRKNTIFWNLDNRVHFYGLLFLIYKTVYIATGEVSLLLCLMSLGIWYFHRLQTGGAIGYAENIIEYSLFNFIVATDLGVAVSVASDNSVFAFSIWIVAMGFALGSCVVTIYQKRVRKLYLPICSSDSRQFYDFYYCCKEEIKGEDIGSRGNLLANHSYVYHLHRFHCKKKMCKLGEWMGSVVDNELEGLITAVLAYKKSSTLDNRIIYELWNLEMGKRCMVAAIAEKELTLSQDFNVYCIEKMTKDSEVTIKNSESNKNAIKKVFYDLIYEIATYYSLFYEELTRSNPTIDTIASHGTAIHEKISRLKEVYAELLKLKLINFKMIELYIQFISKFVSENALDKDDIGRLSKLQQNIYFQDISENYQPTFTLYPESGNVENANAEAQKFMQSTRFELKCKGIADITFPELTVDALRQLMAKEDQSTREEPLFSFFKRAESQFALGSLVLSERNLKGKKLIVVQISEEPFSSQKNAFLVTSDFQLRLSMRQTVKVKAGSYRSQPLTLNWEELFMKYLLENKEKIARSKMLKIVTEVRECTIIVKRLRCAVQDHFILEAQLLLFSEAQAEKGKKRPRSIFSFSRESSRNRTQQQRFEFHYSENEQGEKAVILGLKGNAGRIVEKLAEKTLTTFEKEINAALVDRIITEDTNYCKDIKTYRLYNGELYNVDLEDRDAYNEMFQARIVEKQKAELENNSAFEYYMSVGVVIMGLVLIGLSVFLIVRFQDSTSNISMLSHQHTNIDSLLIDFNRILALLRDLASGFTSKFPWLSVSAEIEDSYNRIQVLKNQPLFNNDEHTIEFQGLQMTGTLIELIDVIFAHINEILNNGNYVVIENIHETSIKLTNQIEQSHNHSFDGIQQEFGSLTVLKNTVLYLSLGIVVLLFLLMVFFCYRSSNKLKGNLAPILYLSDNEAHLHQENASKIKYAVEMIRKNFEVDTQNLLIASTDNKKRKHPKKVVLSNEVVFTIVFLAIVAVSVHLTCLFLFSTGFENSLDHFLKLKQSSAALIQSYSAQAQLANLISHTGQMQAEQIQSININFKYLMLHINSFEFSPQLNSIIHNLFFQNSCDYLKSTYNLTQKQCSLTAPDFTIKNPFEIGLAYYLNRQVYYFYNNVTQNFAQTSIYSRPFAEIMTNLTVMFNEESLETVSSIQGTVNLMSGIIIAIDFCYIVAFFLLYAFFSRQALRIKQIIEFFREKIIVDREEKEDEEKESSDSDNSDSDSEEELAAEQKKGRRRKRTTIEGNLPTSFHND